MRDPINDIKVGPHEFDPAGRFARREECRGCFLPRSQHPVRGWVTARPWRQRRWWH